MLFIIAFGGITCKTLSSTFFNLYVLCVEALVKNNRLLAAVAKAVAMSASKVTSTLLFGMVPVPPPEFTLRTATTLNAWSPVPSAA